MSLAAGSVSDAMVNDLVKFPSLWKQAQWKVVDGNKSSVYFFSQMIHVSNTLPNPLIPACLWETRKKIQVLGFELTKVWLLCTLGE